MKKEKMEECELGGVGENVEGDNEIGMCRAHWALV